MKSMTKFLGILFVTAFLFSGCSEKKVLKSELTKDNGIFYFEGKPFTGISLNYFLENKVGIEEKLKDGKLVNVKFYYEDGVIKGEAEFNSDSIGKMKVYNEKGKLIMEGEMKFLNIRRLFRNNFPGKEDGDSWEEKMEKESRITLRGWEKQGIWNNYDENRRIIEKSEFKNGQLEGISEVYFDNGNLKEKHNFKGGRKNGYSTFYEANGKVIDEMLFKDGKLVSNDKPINQNLESAEHPAQGEHPRR